MTSHVPRRPDLKVIDGGLAPGSDATTRTRRRSPSPPSPATGRTSTPEEAQSSKCAPSKTKREVRVLICGSHRWQDHEPIALLLGGLFYASPSYEIVVAHGGEQGADTVAHDVAKRLGISVEVYRPDRAKHYGRARFLRDKAVLEDFEPDFLLVFAESPLPRDVALTVELARKKGITTFVLGHAPVGAIPAR